MASEEVQECFDGTVLVGLIEAHHVYRAVPSSLMLQYEAQLKVCLDNDKAICYKKHKLWRGQFKRKK